MNDIEQIYELIKSGSLPAAYDIVKEKLSEKYNLNDEKELRVYKELIKLRITIKTLLHEDDTIIGEYIRSEMYDQVTEYRVNKYVKIKLTPGSNFNSKVDAYVNTVSIEEPFEKMGERSATKHFVNYIGIDEIKKQLATFNGPLKGNYLIIKHPKMLTPFSYHIGFYTENEPDLSVLKEGIQNVLEDAVNKKLGVLAFFPLGYDYVNRVIESDKNSMAKKLAECIAETIVRFVWENENKDIPEIHFNISNIKTLQTFDKAFYHYSAMPQMYYKESSYLTKLEKEMLEKVNTSSKEFIEEIKRVAFTIPSDTNLLILGETGVGKTRFANIVHELSSRRLAKFVSVNCSFLSRRILPIELFGWVKGSFTNATKDGEGAIGVANGGTLFLDEIAYTDLEVQKSLLKFLDDGKYTKFGAKNKELTADVRLIFGTSANFDYLIAKKLFLPEFYERINKVCFTIPPLRKRKEDISLIGENILSQLNKLSNTQICFDIGTYAELKKYKWPGNIRQLKNHIENLYNIAIYNNLKIITPEMVSNDPPRDALYNEAGKITLLESSLFELLKDWDENKGKFIDKVLNPVLAKVYLEDLKKPRTESNKFLGMDGNNPKTNRLDRYAKEYDKVSEYIDID